MLPVVDEDHDETDRDIIEDHNIPCGNISVTSQDLDMLLVWAGLK